MVTTALSGALPVECPSCGSTEVAITYTAPVHVEVRDLRVMAVRVDDESRVFGGSALCGICGRRWRLLGDPETGPWPEWEVGP